MIPFDPAAVFLISEGNSHESLFEHSHSRSEVLFRCKRCGVIAGQRSPEGGAGSMTTTKEKTKPGFKITGGKGFHITFENGWTVSVQFGGGNYSVMIAGKEAASA